MGLVLGCFFFLSRGLLELFHVLPLFYHVSYVLLDSEIFFKNMRYANGAVDRRRLTGARRWLNFARKGGGHRLAIRCTCVLCVGKIKFNRDPSKKRDPPFHIKTRSQTIPTGVCTLQSSQSQFNRCFKMQQSRILSVLLKRGG